jgi:hypothetical protein
MLGSPHAMSIEPAFTLDLTGPTLERPRAGGPEAPAPSRPFASLRRAAGVAAEALLFAGFTSPAGPPPAAPAVRCWLDGDTEGALAALEASPPGRERDLNLGVVRQYTRDVARTVVEPDIASAAPGPVLPPSALHPGERLRFRVKYYWVSLASLTLEVGDPIELGGQAAQRVVFTAKSNPGIFFFHIDSRFESVIGEDGAVLSHRYSADDSATGADEGAYDMERAAGRCTFRMTKNGRFAYEVLPLPAHAQDGISVLLLARALARVRGSLRVPTAVDGVWNPTELRTLGPERRHWKGREVATVHLQSFGRYKGPAGLSGVIDMWISDDDRAVPYRARMKVSVGSVTIELLPDEHTPA